MSKGGPDWTVDRFNEARRNPQILIEGAWGYLHNLDADESMSKEGRLVAKVNAVTCDANWWDLAVPCLVEAHGEDAIARFYEDFSDGDALRHRGVAIFGKPALDKSLAAEACRLAAQSKLDYPPKHILEIKEDLAAWLLNVIEYRDSHTVRQLAQVLDDWPKDIPDFDYLERFPIKRGVDPRKSEKFLILKVFSNCLQKDQRLPTKSRIAELRVVVELGEDPMFHTNMKELGLKQLPSE